MSEIAIRVENLGKQYKIGRLQKRHDTLRDKISDFSEIRRRLSIFDLAKRRNGKNHQSEIKNQQSNDFIWALRDVSFEVKRGEVVGIIGRNGAGKSTLLKILSRITEPTTGAVDLYGRVASLLEVGTGFHPELTGRENIFLNGAILGMHRTEIERKFDEIVAFAEVEKFIDTPVKRYSSGMYVRLAFAVAAHLEPEILLVDEVLAVGDAAFQKKCLGKMGDVAREGRTVLFVSHDMTNVAMLCSRALLLDEGQCLKEGSSRTVIEYYHNRVSRKRAAASWNLEDAPGEGSAKILAIKVCGPDGEVSESFALTDAISVSIDFITDDTRLNPVILVKNSLGATVFSSANYEEPKWGSIRYASGQYRSVCSIPEHILNDGQYSVDVLLVQETRFVKAIAKSVVEFSVIDGGETRGDFLGEWTGVVRPRCVWQTSPTT